MGAGSTRKLLRLTGVGRSSSSGWSLQAREHQHVARVVFEFLQGRRRGKIALGAFAKNLSIKRAAQTRMSASPRTKKARAR
jgi:hypothetical protein